MNKKKEVDLIILVIASDNKQFYIKFMEIYWLKLINYIKNNKLNIQLYLVFGKHPVNIDVPLENLIVSNTPENLIPGVLMKTIFAFEYINKLYNYNHVLRTNLSSFFILDYLFEIKKTLKHDNLYNGVIGKNNNKKFVSGAGFWLSRDVVNYLLENKEKLNFNKIDDVSIGFLLEKYIKKNIGNSRYDIVKNKCKNKSFESIVNEIKNGKHYHIRFKSNDRLNDIKLMDKLFKVFYT